MTKNKKPGVPITAVSQLRLGMRIAAKYFGKLYPATVLEENRISVDGLGEFNTIGDAGRAITEGKWTPTLSKGRFWYAIEGAAIYDEEGRPVGGQSISGLEGADEPEQPSEEEVQFALEQHLEDFMYANWSRISFGRRLKLYHGTTGETGRQFPTEVGVVDFLCEDTDTDDLVVIELKKGRSSDKVLGQCQRYMGWVQENLAKAGQKVRGLIVAPEQDDRLRYALKVAPDVQMLCYRVDFHLFSPSEERRA